MSKLTSKLEVADRKNSQSKKWREEIIGLNFSRTDVIPMWIADMDFKTFDKLTEALKSRADFPNYGYEFRTKTHTEVFQNWMKSRHEVDFKDNEITYMQSTIGTFALLVDELSEEGDEIIYQPPVYFPFESTIKNAKRKAIKNELILRDGRYYLDVDTLRKQAKTAKMMIICNPHNPVGKVWTRDELQMIVEICKENNVLLFSDEVHGDLAFEEYTSIGSISKEGVTFYAPAKTFNIPAINTSVICSSNRKILDIVDNFGLKFHINNPNSFSAAAFECVYTHGGQWLEDVIVQIRKNVEILKDGIEKTDIKLIEPEGTYLMWLDFRAYNLADKILADKILEAGVALNPGVMFGAGGAGFMRMNIACSEEILKEAINKIVSAFN